MGTISIHFRMTEIIYFLNLLKKRILKMQEINMKFFSARHNHSFISIQP